MIPSRREQRGGEYNKGTAERKGGFAKRNSPRLFPVPLPLPMPVPVFLLPLSAFLRQLKFSMRRARAGARARARGKGQKRAACLMSLTVSPVPVPVPAFCCHLRHSVVNSSAACVGHGQGQGQGHGEKGRSGRGVPRVVDGRSRARYLNCFPDFETNSRTRGEESMVRKKLGRG